MDETDRAERRAAELVGLISAATAELVELIASVLAGNLWPGYGINTPEHWVALRCGVTTAHAKWLVASAKVLPELPSCRAAFAAGEITADHVAEIARAGVTAIHDDEVAALAKEATVHQLRKGLSFLPHPEPVAPEPAATPAPEPDHDERPRPQVSFGFDDDGMWGLHARLHAGDGALLEKALTAARDAEFRARYGDDADPTGTDQVSWVDTLIRLGHAGLDTLDTDTAGGHSPGHRFQVLLHLNGDTGHAGLHLGPRLDPDEQRRVTCDAMVRAWFVGPDGSVNLGRRARVVDAKLRMVVEHRDGGCVIPGCGARRWLHVHHLAHWEHGGPTDTNNLVSLCGAHHRAVHHGHLTITGNPDQPATLNFVDGRGRPLGHSPPVPPRRALPDAATDLGINSPRYRTRSGERAQWDMLFWREPPPPDADP